MDMAHEREETSDYSKVFCLSDWQVEPNYTKMGDLQEGQVEVERISWIKWN